MASILESQVSALNEGANILPLTEQLRAARSIQRALLPQSIPVLRGWDVAGCCISSGPIGGDFYDVFKLPSGNTMLLVADVMGKGIPAALIASVTRTVVRMAVSSTSGPAETFTRVNEMLYEDLSSADMFVTAQAAWLDVENGTLRLASAGHCPMLLRNSGGEVQQLCPNGIPIGVAPSVSYSEEVIALADCECALMYTDGITEARSPLGEPFGPENLERWFRTAGAATRSASAIQEALVSFLEKFHGGAEPTDDQTVLVLANMHPKALPVI
jgi:serine phosphatase RsbU (regulator of sigma subunit)